MIEGKVKSKTVDYYKIEMDSASSLKEFSLDRKRYFRKYISKEKVEEDESQASLMGSLVDCLLFTSEQFDNQFCMSCLHKAPTGLSLAFVEALYKHTVANPNSSFEDRAKAAYTDSGYKISFEKAIEKFSGTDAEIYFKEILDIRQKGLKVVTVQDVTNAENIVLSLKTNEFTAPIINQETNDDFDVYKQLKIEGYTINNHKFKSMLDLVHVDHKKKTIQVYDLKVVWSTENFYEDYFLYRRAYIQLYLYYTAIQLWTIENGYSTYNILYPRYIVADSINWMSPLIYTTKGKDIIDANTGFEHKGRIYPGVSNLIDALNWAIENNIWNISMNNYLTKGIVKLNE